MGYEESRDASVQGLAEGALFLFVGFLLSNVSWYLYRVLIAQSFGPADYGRFSLAFSVFNIAMLAGLVGLPSGINRYTSKYIGKMEDGKIRGTVISALEISIPLSAVAAVLLFAGAPLLSSMLGEPEAAPLLRIFAVALPLRAVMTNLLAVFRGFNRMDYFTAFEHVGKNLLLLLLTAFLIFSGSGVASAVIAYAVATAFAAAGCFLVINQRLVPLFRKGVERNHRELFGFSLPMTVNSMDWMVNYQIDNLMMGWIATTAAAGIGVYNAARPTAEIVKLSGIVFGMTLFPAISTRLSQGDAETARGLASSAIRWTALVSLPPAIFLVLTADPFISLVFGAEYASGSGVLILITAATFLNACTLPLAKFLPARDKPGWVAFNRISVILLNAALNLVLIPAYGIMGAAMATAVAMAAGSALVVTEVVFGLGVRPRIDGLRELALAGMAAALVLKAVMKSASQSPVMLLAGALALATTYAAVFILSGGIREEDIVAMEVVEEKTGIDLGYVRDLLERFRA